MPFFEIKCEYSVNSRFLKKAWQKLLYCYALPPPIEKKKESGAGLSLIVFILVNIH